MTTNVLYPAIGGDAMDTCLKEEETSALKAAIIGGDVGDGEDEYSSEYEYEYDYSEDEDEVKVEQQDSRVRLRQREGQLMQRRFANLLKVLPPASSLKLLPPLPPRLLKPKFHILGRKREIQEEEASSETDDGHESGGPPIASASTRVTNCVTSVLKFTDKKINAGAGLLGHHLVVVGHGQVHGSLRWPLAATQAAKERQLPKLMRQTPLIL